MDNKLKKDYKTIDADAVTKISGGRHILSYDVRSLSHSLLYKILFECVNYLAHKVGDDAVEGGTLEAVPLLPCAERAEVLAGFGNHVASQLQNFKSQFQIT